MIIKQQKQRQGNRVFAFGSQSLPDLLFFIVFLVVVVVVVPLMSRSEESHMSPVGVSVRADRLTRVACLFLMQRQEELCGHTFDRCCDGNFFAVIALPNLVLGSDSQGVGDEGRESGNRDDGTRGSRVS